MTQPKTDAITMPAIRPAYAKRGNSGYNSGVAARERGAIQSDRGSSVVQAVTDGAVRLCDYHLHLVVGVVVIGVVHRRRRADLGHLVGLAERILEDLSSL